MTVPASPLVSRHLDLSYEQGQDRLRLVLRNADAAQSFWLTRRLSRALLKGLLDLLMRTSGTVGRVSTDIRSDVLLFEHVDAISRRSPSAASSDGNGGSAAASPAPSPDILIPDQIDLSASGNQVSLSCIVAGEAVAVMPMSRDNAHQFVGILYDRARLAEWDLNEFGWLDRRGQFVIPENHSRN